MLMKERRKAMKPRNLFPIMLALLLALAPGTAAAHAEEPYTEATIAAVGDIMTMPIQASKHFERTTRTYDFTGDYTYVKPVLEAADCAIGNFESTFANQRIRYGGYPRFSAPDELGDALKYAGFDILNFANNHVNDFKEAGLLRTLDVMKTKGFGITGMRPNLMAENFIIRDIKGIKVGFTGYTFETSRSKSGIKAINGHRMTEMTSMLLNSYGKRLPPTDAYEIARTIAKMKQDGAEFIVFYMHWGNEGTTRLAPIQKRIAQLLADNEVDVVFGMHAHILQQVGSVASQASAHKTLVWYSLGNFISNMGGMRSGLSPCDTMIAGVRIRKNNATGEVSIAEAGYLPLSCRMTEKWYPPVPVKDANGVLQQYSRIYNRIDRVVGQSAKAVTDFKISEWLTPENFSSKK
jgi:poly-gamma-glutamate capsule biosynthesis protein CapA/YwtB (metallophosphatase superfamily)